MADEIMQDLAQTAPVAENRDKPQQRATSNMAPFAPPLQGPTQAMPRAGTALTATAQLLTFAPGLYAVDFIVTRSAVTASGLRLPCVRLEPAPAGPQSAGRCFVSVLAEGGWLSQSDQPTYIRSVGGVSAVVFTIYTLAGETAPPEIRIRKIPFDGANPAPTGAVDVNSQPAPTAGSNARPLLPVVQLVHIQGVGDVQAAAEQWAGQPGSGRQIEGFAIIPDSAALKAEDIEYQAIMGEQWNTPWSRGGIFCGSRGMGLPLLGFRIRLTGTLAEHYMCSYWGSFANKGVTGPIRAGAACEADGAVLEALRLVITPRVTQAAEPTGQGAVPPAQNLGGEVEAPSAAGSKPAQRPKRPTRDKAP